MKEIIGQQGEVRIIKIDAIPEGIIRKKVEQNKNGYFIISHSENGNHHVLTGGEVMEQENNVPQGMQIFYAILNSPECFKQDAAVPHGQFDLPPGIYEFRNSRQHNSFLKQAQKVRD